MTTLQAWRMVRKRLRSDFFICRAVDNLFYLGKIDARSRRALLQAVEAERVRLGVSKKRCAELGLWPMDSVDRLAFVERKIARAARAALRRTER